MRLQDKVVVVTGAGGRIGRAFTRAIVENGGVAIAADINLSSAETVVGNLADIGPGRVEAASLDITDAASVGEMIAGVEGRYGRIDAVVNNAYPRNAAYGRMLEDVTYADFCDNVGMHVGGYFLVAQQFCRLFREQGFGNIVNMSSIYGVIAPRFEVYAGTTMTTPVEYAAIKSAVLHLTRYFAQYFKGTGIRVNAISPGGIRDNQAESFLAAYDARCAGKGMLDVSDLLGALVFLLSDESRFMTGQNLVVDDGFTL